MEQLKHWAGQIQVWFVRLTTFCVKVYLVGFIFLYIVDHYFNFHLYKCHSKSKIFGHLLSVFFVCRGFYSLLCGISNWTFFENIKKPKLTKSIQGKINYNKILIKHLVSAYVLIVRTWLPFQQNDFCTY